MGVCGCLLGMVRRWWISRLGSVIVRRFQMWVGLDSSPWAEAIHDKLVVWV